MTNTENTPAPIEHNDGATVFTGVGIELYRAATVAMGLAMKIETGVNLTRSIPGRSPLQVANEISSTLNWEWISEVTSETTPKQWASKRTNAGALLDLALFMRVVWEWSPTTQVTRALDEKKLAAVLKKADKVRAALLVILAAEEAAAAGAS